MLWRRCRALDRADAQGDVEPVRDGRVRRAEFSRVSARRHGALLQRRLLPAATAPRPTARLLSFKLTGAAKRRRSPPSGSFAPTAISSPRGRAGSALRTNVASSWRMACAAPDASPLVSTAVMSPATRDIVRCAVARPTPAAAGYSSSIGAMAAAQLIPAASRARRASNAFVAHAWRGHDAILASAPRPRSRGARRAAAPKSVCSTRRR